MRGGARGLSIRREGSEEFLYHCDNVKGFVRKTTLDGDVEWVLHCPFMSGVYRSAKEYKPANLAIAPNGDIYVADGYGKFYIRHYDAKTNYIRTFGGSREEINQNPGKETAAGTTIWPHAIAVDTRGPKPLLMVGERVANSRIQYFTMDGKPLYALKDGVRWPSIFEFRKQRLSALEDKMKAIARVAQTEQDLFEARLDLDATLRPYRSKMTADQFAVLERQYLERHLLEKANLPRLSLFYLV